MPNLFDLRDGDTTMTYHAEQFKKDAQNLNIMTDSWIPTGIKEFIEKWYERITMLEQLIEAANHD